MTRSDLITKLFAVHPTLPQQDIDLSVRVILDAMSRTLIEGGRIEIRGFGSFGLNHRPARTGRNPKTGQTVKIPAKYAPHVKPGKELRERVDK